MRTTAVSVGPDDFKVIDTIGKGAFGKVYKVKKRDNGLIYAMKALYKEKVFGKNLVKYAKTERNILSSISHPFIVKLHYAF
jgi:serine/threonine protein kinase